jgi:putative heme iron utilization protein
MTEHNPITQSHQAYRELLARAQTAQLATTDADGKPEASYSPVWVDPNGCFYIYVSELARHTRNLLGQKQASLMFIEDESASQHIHARRRATFDCSAREVPRGTEDWNTRLDQMTGKFGNMIEGLRQLEDFHLIELRPKRGRLVVGFGRAYELSGETMDTLSHIGGESGGHRKKR